MSQVANQSGRDSQVRLPLATEVADYLVQLAARDGVELDQLKLQKILYFIQGWSLSSYGKPAFTGEIEAWRHGPVVRSVYDKFRKYGRQPITPDDPPEINLPESVRAYYESVWNLYKNYTGPQLADMTHKHDAWKQHVSFLGGFWGNSLIPAADLRQQFDALSDSVENRISNSWDKLIELADAQDAG